MKNPAQKVLLTAAVLIPVTVHAQPRPGNLTTATVITKAEIDMIGTTEQSQRIRGDNAKAVDIGDGWKHGVGAAAFNGLLRAGVVCLAAQINPVKNSLRRR